MADTVENSSSKVDMEKSTETEKPVRTVHGIKVDTEFRLLIAVGACCRYNQSRNIFIRS